MDFEMNVMKQKKQAKNKQNQAVKGSVEVVNELKFSLQKIKQLLQYRNISSIDNVTKVIESLLTFSLDVVGRGNVESEGEEEEEMDLEDERYTHTHIYICIYFCLFVCLFVCH